MSELHPTPKPYLGLVGTRKPQRPIPSCSRTLKDSRISLSASSVICSRVIESRWHRPQNFKSSWAIWSCLRRLFHFTKEMPTRTALMSMAMYLRQSTSGSRTRCSVSVAVQPFTSVQSIATKVMRPMSCSL